MKKRAVGFGKVLIAVGASLSVLVVVETYQTVVSARSAPAQAIIQPSSANIPEPPTASTIPEGSLSATPRQGAQAAPTLTAQASPNSLAISAGEPDASAQDLSGMSANQIAATRSQWAGASFPLEQFQAYTSPFGYRRSIDGYNFNEFHYGLDLAAPQGSYIRNWWGGTVVEVSDDSNCGTSVVVESGDWLSIFCHMEGLVESANGERYMIDRAGGVRIVEGQELPAGQRVGRVGMTGRTTGPHLHWGLKFQNNWVDPALVLRAMYDDQRSASSQIVN